MASYLIIIRRHDRDIYDITFRRFPVILRLIGFDAHIFSLRYFIYIKLDKSSPDGRLSEDITSAAAVAAPI